MRESFQNVSRIHVLSGPAGTTFLIFGIVALMDKCLQSATSISPQLRFVPLVQVPPLPECEVCVIVPVRNEAENLEQTLAALALQTELDGQRFDRTRYEVIVLANNCSDASGSIARQFALAHPEFVLHVVERMLSPQEAYIGRVRQLLMDEAYRRLHPLGRQHGIIASTDGDSQVSSTWIAATIHEIGQGADAVGGRILTDQAERSALPAYARACFLREVGYRYLIAELEAYLDPNPHDCLPRHYQHYGASFAVTTEMYALAGGMQPVRTPEDVAFYRALLRVNARFRHSPHVRVTTSARQTGRTAQGLANQLNEWTEMGRHHQSFLVEPAGAIAARFQARRELHQLWLRMLNGYLPLTQEVSAIADQLGLPTQWLANELTQPSTFGALFERVEQQQESGLWQTKWQLVPIEQAIQELRSGLEQLRRNQLVNLSDSTLPSAPTNQVAKFPLTS